ncbi:non-hydrolyzing UDP-N-acetylglucosamine 2-epimerase [Brumimicrobium sp.]|uniref:non-hydrolyzing UDP-N-acetylglucosamine 2-epimerase n=1 Tax=Brumimicrobium sp. TaxID=2029867 RepID=UPI003A95973A
MKIVTVIGARPQFVKAAVLSRNIRELNSSGARIQEIIIHTGQHYDVNMSEVFFDELNIPKPDYYLGIGGKSHGHATGEMIKGIEDILIKESPDFVVLYGDTNSTLSGAIAASKLGIRVAHIEAGLRSFNRAMPEEVNRVLTDHVSDICFAPTQLACDNLAKEGITSNVINCGDIMNDASLFYSNLSDIRSCIVEDEGLCKGEFVLVTCHRQENTDSKEKLQSILESLSVLTKDTTVILPLHPRTNKKIEEYGLVYLLDNVKILPPVPMLDMIALEKNASCIITDSGGVQKEAYIFQVPCITMREETEWVETVDSGWNTLVGSNKSEIVNAYHNLRKPDVWSALYGDGNTGRIILDRLLIDSNAKQY